MDLDSWSDVRRSIRGINYKEDYKAGSSKLELQMDDQMDYVLNTRIIGCEEVDQTDYVLEYEDDWIQEID